MLRLNNAAGDVALGRNTLLLDEEAGASPCLFFVGAAIEKKMASEIWTQLENGVLSNAANLNEENQVASISRWLCHL